MFTRKTFNFTPKTTAALERSVARSETNETEAVSRAVQLKDFVETRQEEGFELCMRAPDGSVEKIHIL